MSKCEDCRLRGQKCFVARILSRLVALSSYGFVLALIGGTIIWGSLAVGLSGNIAILAAAAFLGLELALFLMGGAYAPGLLITAVLFGPLFLWIKRQTTYKPVSKTGRQMIRDALLVRNVTA